MMLLAPTDKAMELKALMWAMGMPSLSNSFETAAPQRVQVPQVEVRMTACTPSFFN